MGLFPKGFAGFLFSISTLVYSFSLNMQPLTEVAPWSVGHSDPGLSSVINKSRPPVFQSRNDILGKLSIAKIFQ